MRAIHCPTWGEIDGLELAEVEPPSAPAQDR